MTPIEDALLVDLANARRIYAQVQSGTQHMSDEELGDLEDWEIAIKPTARCKGCARNFLISLRGEHSHPRSSSPR